MKEHINTIAVLDIGSAKTVALICEIGDSGLRYRGHGMVESRGSRKGIITELDKAVHSVHKAVDEAEKLAQEVESFITQHLDRDYSWPGNFRELEQCVRNILIRAYQYLIAKFDLDGYRIDTLMYIERDFARIFGNAMREFALSIGKTNFFTFGEVWMEENESLISQYHGRSTSDADIWWKSPLA